ncbi:uncharacterized protein LOC109603643 isoform X2 [Aethina tumida]|uniref:uncharacterized protein LOC109603643 isoform X2 n=1 Tax=Aethina tumida TaxID=116153 RepID=UPI002147C75D|nr:uncharacterized protein LOC109603643 isoform X2 [Aethina tumida]
MEWTLTWTIVAVTSSIVFILILSFIYCICLYRKTASTQQFYIIEEGGMKTSSSLDVFRHFTSTGNLRNMPVFTSENLPIFKKHDTESDLLDSMDLTKKIGSVSSKKDDMASCISDDSSRHSFHSAYPPITRQCSEADGYVSFEDVSPWE